jgi:hypothetical protein
MWTDRAVLVDFDIAEAKSTLVRCSLWLFDTSVALPQPDRPISETTAAAANQDLFDVMRGAFIGWYSPRRPARAGDVSSQHSRNTVRRRSIGDSGSHLRRW